MTITTYLLKDWQFKNQKDSSWMNTKVPSTIHMDLYRNNIIPHPFEGTNEKDLQWIDKENWEYRTEFTLEEKVYSEDNLEVTFEGLDTVTTILINDQEVLKTDNMFRIWRLNIKPFVKKGKNSITIIFHSPVEYGLKKLDESEYILPATMDESEMGGIRDKKVSMFLRKAPYHFGWDWGPRFATSGIWREVKIRAWSSLTVRDSHIEQSFVSAEKANVTFHTTVKSDTTQTSKYSLKVDNTTVRGKVYLKEGYNELSVPLTLDNPELWWTHDLGKQNMTLFHFSIEDMNGKSIDSTVKTGIRSVELVRENDKDGTSFYFKLNGVPLFIKGANHIPLDSFLPEVEDSRYDMEIKRALDAHMNMIRVWGGGIYEEDIFYDLCDEYGLLVWQDFMFSCSMYPGNESFLNNIALEAEDNIKRLRNHPSLAIWCGNNEIDSMWKEFTDKTYLKWKEAYTPEIREKVWQAYDTIFHKILPEKLNELMPEASYWPSSPMAELSYSESQHASLDGPKGDIHLWNVWHGGSSIESYNNYIGRFMSEYGFQSFPEKETFVKIADGQQLTLDSEIIAFHQKNKSGNSILNKYLEHYYDKPNSFESFIFLTQVLQGYALETAIRAHRREMPYCMGTLYWQLNDVWPGASWSTIDYYGNRKLSHFKVKEANKESIVAYKDTEDKFHIFGITDSLKQLELTLSVQIYSLEENATVLEFSEPVVLDSQSSSLLRTIDKTKLFGKFSKKNILINSSLKSKDNDMIDTYSISFEPMKNLNLQEPDITCRTEIKDNTIHFFLNSSTFVKSVVIELDLDGHFETNGLDLFPGTESLISFVAKDIIIEQQLPKPVIRSMVDFIKKV